MVITNNKTISRLFLALWMCLSASQILAGDLPATTSSTLPDTNLVSVEGTVVSVDGKPLPKMFGVCRNQETGKLGPQWRSGQDGKFLVKLELGRYKIWARGSMAKAVELVAKPGDDKVSIKVIGDPMRNGLQLKFESPDGKPLSNTSISYAEAGGKGFLKTDANGLSMYTPYEAFFHLFFNRNKVGFADLIITSEEVAFSDEPVLVRLNSGAFVSGRVVSDKTGAPIGGVPIFPEMIETNDDRWSWWNSQFGFKSYEFTMKDTKVISRDGDGTFTIGPLPPGKYKLLAGLPGIWHEFPSTDLITPIGKRVDLTSGSNLDGVKLKVPVNKPAYTFTGRALNSDKTPVASKEITVEVSGDYEPTMGPEEWYVWEPVERTVVTDAKGNFRLFPIRPGKYAMVAKSGSLSSTKVLAIKSNGVKADFVLR